MVCEKLYSKYIILLNTCYSVYLIIKGFIRHKQSSEYKVLQTDLDITDAY